MSAYIIRRLIQGFIVMILVTLIVFLMMRLLPGDPVLMYLSADDFDAATAEEVAALRHEWGLDKPLMVQYFVWIGDIARGDFGMSLMQGTEVSDEIGRALPRTLYLGIIAWVVSHTLGPIMGLIAAVRRGKWPDTVLTSLATLGICIPIFWLGILFIYLFGLRLGWFPIQGYTSPFDDLVLSLRKMFMPAFVMSVTHLAGSARQMRSAMLEVIRQDYIRTAWSKGLGEGTIIMRHALKNAIIPVVTLSGLSIRNIFGGTVLIESVFNIPGMGRLSVIALHGQDYAIVQGVILVVAFVVVISNLLVDISYGWLDPRIRYQ
ncbi:ABC transporter permease [Chloroflexota bacterium]